MQNIAWKLKAPLDALSSLFRPLDTGYIVHAFICSCEAAVVETVITEEACESSFACPHCDNEDFCDGAHFCGPMIWHTPVTKLFEMEVLSALKPTCSAQHLDALTYEVGIDIPTQILLTQNKLVYTTQVLYRVTLDAHQGLIEEACVNMDGCELLDRYKAQVLTYLQRDALHPLFVASKTLNEAAFFYAHPHLVAYEFFYWEDVNLLPVHKRYTIEEALGEIGANRSEKSFKKALYKHYNTKLNAMDRFNVRTAQPLWHEGAKAESGRWYPKWAWVVSRLIDDVNIATRMLFLELDTHLLGIPIENLWAYVTFLRRHYSLKQLERLFMAYAHNDTFWLRDTLGLFEILEETLDSLPKTSCSMVALHDAFATHLHSKEIEDILSKVIFDYQPHELLACGTFGAYEVKLPSGGLDLFMWGSALQNCLTSYYKPIQEGQTTVFGFFKEEVLCFAIEMTHGTLTQARYKYNEPLTEEDARVVEAWVRRSFNDTGFLGGTF